MRLIWIRCSFLIDFRAKLLVVVLNSVHQYYGTKIGNVSVKERKTATSRFTCYKLKISRK